MVVRRRAVAALRQLDLLDIAALYRRHAALRPPVWSVAGLPVGDTRPVLNLNRS